MPRKYEKKEIIERIEKIIKENKISKLYAELFIKRTGETSDSRELYSEIASKTLLDNDAKSLFCRVVAIPRFDYKVNHTGKINVNSNREEEKLAINLKGKTLQPLGRILEYQIPLKAKQSDKGVGKVDLISKNDESKKSFIVELKAKNNKEGLLKAVLEIITYGCQIREGQILKDFGLNYKPLTQSILLEEGCRGQKEADELDCRPNLKRLIQEFNLEIYIYNKDKDLIRKVI